MKCPICGAENQTGKYCGECGAALQSSCTACGSAVAPGSRFCTSCGEPLAPTARESASDSSAAAGMGAADAGPPGWSGGRSRAALVIAAAALLVVVLVLFLPRQADRVPVPRAGPETPLRAPGSAGAGEGGARGVDLSSDMRTNADRLFNRIMAADQQGDQAEVDRFMPMAIQAYGMVEDLDQDGLYHLAILHFTAGEYAEARRTAQRILGRSADHILALGVAASAAEEAGDTAAARTLWGRLLDVYPQESEKPLPEYVDHRTMLTQYRDKARQAIGRG